MDTSNLLRWCADYKQAWETQDPELFVTLFTNDCKYRDSPFSVPIPGWAFREFWRALAKRQRDNRIEFEILGWASGNRAILKWHATTTRPESLEQREGSGIFVLTFDDDRCCSDVWEWQHWHILGAPFERPTGYDEFVGKGPPR